MRWYTPGAVEGIWFSPSKGGSGDWKYLQGVRVLVHYGGKEGMRDEIVKLVKDMKEAGVEVQLREVSPEPTFHSRSFISRAG